MKYICVYCGSSEPREQKLKSITEELGKAIARAGYGLVYGGASVGLMGIIAKTIMDEGQPVCGIIPHMLGKRELNRLILTEVHEVNTMSERKMMMLERASAFIALPGGIGTMDELCECLSLSSLGVHKNPVILYNVGGYYDKLLAFFDDTVKAGFMSEDFRHSIISVDTPEAVLNAIEGYQPPPKPDWVDLEAVK